MTPDTDIFPKHICIICDGNRRWAREHALEVFLGHEYAVNKVLQPLIEQAMKRGVSYLTFWVFSTENWDRDPEEVRRLMDLFRSFFDDQVDTLAKKGVKINMIGNIEDFEPDIQERIREGMEKTKDNDKITVTLAMSYGGRDDLKRGIKQIAAEVAEGKLKIDDITDELISSHLDTAGMPDPDYIIRTSGEHRTSGFMLWQSNYAEYYFPKFHFPEFTPERFDEALSEFSKRKRRFGK